MFEMILNIILVILALLGVLGVCGLTSVIVVRFLMLKKNNSHNNLGDLMGWCLITGFVSIFLILVPMICLSINSQNSPDNARIALAKDFISQNYPDFNTTGSTFWIDKNNKNIVFAKRNNDKSSPKIMEVKMQELIPFDFGLTIKEENK